jgi:hypothetical protein
MATGTLPKLPVSPGFQGFALDGGYGQLSAGSGPSNIVCGAAAGGQAGSTQLPAIVNRVNVGNTNDGVQLPVSVVGSVVTVINVTGNSINVYPTGTDVINALSGGAAYALANTKVATFFCGASGFWNTILTA